uniref:Nuclear receptor domain-containing protein n=1 Tax=Globodera pallida TaxID=36090 RepID=A0A183C254_GLOPA
MGLLKSSRSSASPSDNATIECVVCGAHASGLHYMVWSCNGCKTFFRRAIMENRKYSCARNGKCQIGVKNRCCCRHCRFEKCIKVGMTFTELNVERKRKVHMANASILVEQFSWDQEDPLVRELLAKQRQFRTLLTSSFTPIFSTLDHALQQPSVFDGSMKIFENFQLEIPELNVERKRKVHMANASILVEQFSWDQEDPLVRELLAKQRQFRTLLTSSFTPIFSTLDHALQQPSVFDGSMKIFENFQLEIPGNQLDFYDWRARILSITVEWIKSFSEFKGIPSSDQRSLIVHCSFALLVFSEAFQTPERFSDRLVYPDGLQVTRNFSRGICIPQNGLIRGIVAVINFILAPIRRIQLTEVEYVFLQTLLLFDTDCLSLSESTLRLVASKQEILFVSLQRYLFAKMGANSMGSANRMAQLLLRISNIQKVAAFKRQFFIDENSLNILGSNCAKSSFAIQLANLYPDISFF